MKGFSISVSWELNLLQVPVVSKIKSIFQFTVEHRFTELWMHMESF